MVFGRFIFVLWNRMFYQSLYGGGISPLRYSAIPKADRRTSIVGRIGDHPRVLDGLYTNPKHLRSFPFDVVWGHNPYRDQRWLDKNPACSVLLPTQWLFVL